MSATKLILWMLAFVVVGGPLVFVLWSFMNELLQGNLDRGLLFLAVPGLLIFGGLLAYLARWVRRVEGPEVWP